MNPTLSTYRNVYFIGIGGIGMSALARWFMANGYRVGGYDKTASSLIEALAEEGAFIHLQDDITTVPEHFKQSPEETLVVYTPAIPRLHSELRYFQNQQFKVLKRAAVLGLISQDYPTVGVAGTHGKTTTSTFVAHLLKSSGLNSGAFLGGISSNYNSNLLLPENTEKEAWVTVEADEYDRSFLQLTPQIAVITAIEPDHLDIYGSAEAVFEAFDQYIAKIKVGGVLIHQADVTFTSARGGLKVISYGIEKGDVKATNVRIENHQFKFEVVASEQQFEVALAVPGFHNVENCLAAIVVGLQLGIPVGKLVEGVSTFKGVQRRFDYHIKKEGRVYIDDYAHHPTELRAFLKSVKSLYPEWPLTVIFQPHLYSRTRDFAVEFAESLSLADQVILLDIYPAREEPIEGVTSSWLLEKVSVQNKQLLSKEGVLDFIRKEKPACLVTAGAGDIDRLVPQIKGILSE